MAHPYLALAVLDRAFPWPLAVQEVLGLFLGAQDADERWASPGLQDITIPIWVKQLIVNSDRFVLYHGHVVDDASWRLVYRNCPSVRTFGPVPEGLEALARLPPYYYDTDESSVELEDHVPIVFFFMHLLTCCTA